MTKAVERPSRMERIMAEFEREWRREKRNTKKAKEIFSSVQNGQMEKVEFVREVLINKILSYKQLVDFYDLEISNSHYIDMTKELLDILGYEDTMGEDMEAFSK